MKLQTIVGDVLEFHPLDDGGLIITVPTVSGSRDFQLTAEARATLCELALPMKDSPLSAELPGYEPPKDESAEPAPVGLEPADLEPAEPVGLFGRLMGRT